MKLCKIVLQFLGVLKNSPYRDDCGIGIWCLLWSRRRITCYLLCLDALETRDNLFADVQCGLLADFVCALPGKLLLLSPNPAALHGNRDHRNDQDGEKQKQLPVTVLAHWLSQKVG